MFKAAMSVNRKLNDKDTHAPFLKATMESIFKAHNDAMNSGSSNEQQSIDSGKNGTSVK